MSQISFEGIGIKAISACVPPRIVKTAEQTKYFTEEQLSGFIATTGIDERRITDDGVTAGDLCIQAAERLFEQLGGVDIKESISCLLFVSQTPDYRMPNTACILQDKLGLSNKIFSLDINQACSGFVWGLMTAYSLCNSGFDNILLLVGDTPSKFLSPNDTSTSLMFGDAGTAILFSEPHKGNETEIQNVVPGQHQHIFINAQLVYGKLDILHSAKPSLIGTRTVIHNGNRESVATAPVLKMPGKLMIADDNELIHQFFNIVHQPIQDGLLSHLQQGLGKVLS